MALIIRNCITGQKTTHKSGKTNLSAAQKNVGMIGHQPPGIDGGNTFAVGPKVDSAQLTAFAQKESSSKNVRSLKAIYFQCVSSPFCRPRLQRG